MRAQRVLVLICFLGLLSACGFLHPSDAQMQRAIGEHVLAEEDYPKEFLQAEDFIFRDLQRIPESDPSRYTVNAEFALVYTADGAEIVAALKQRAQAEREKEKRRTDSPLDELAAKVRGAFKGYGYERRFENVRKGDKDPYRGSFTLIRNADGSWSVESGTYQ